MAHTLAKRLRVASTGLPIGSLENEVFFSKVLNQNHFRNKSRPGHCVFSGSYTVHCISDNTFPQWVRLPAYPVRFGAPVKGRCAWPGLIISIHCIDLIAPRIMVACMGNEQFMNILCFMKSRNLGPFRFQVPNFVYCTLRVVC